MALNRIFVALVLGFVVTGCSPVVSNPVTQVSDYAVPSDPIAYIQDNKLWVSAHDGTGANVVSKDDKEYFAPVWFPNQTTLLYGVVTDDYYEIWIQDLPNGQPEFLFASRTRPQDIAISPNNQFLTYFEGETLHLFNIELRERTRLHEGALAVSWSPDSKAIVFNTTAGSLLLQDFTLQEELDDPAVILDAAVVDPTFVDTRRIVYEAQVEDGSTLVELNLANLETQPLTSLRFDAVDKSANLILEPNGKRLLYIRTDEITLLPNVWIVYVDKDLPKLVLTNVYNVTWSTQHDTLYYQDSAVIAGATIPVIYSATAAGLNKTKILPAAHSVASPAVSISNEYIL